MKGILFKDWKIQAIAEDDREWQTVGQLSHNEL